MTALLKKIWDTLTDRENPWLLFLFLGSLLSLAAFVGDIPKAGIKIQESAYQPLLLLLGALLLMTGIGLVIYRIRHPVAPVRSGKENERADVTQYVTAIGAFIDKPQPRADEQFSPPVMIAGTVSKPPPQDWMLFLIGVGARDRHPVFWPYKEVKILKNQRNWSIEYKSGPGPKELQLYLVGKEGQALINAFYDVNGEQLTKHPGNYAPLRGLTSDMLPACDALHVTIAEPKT